MSVEPLHFVHITDTHIGPTRSYERFGVASWSCADALVRLLNELPVEPDFVVHTGDVVTDPVARSYRLAANLFGRLKFPIFYLTGNHDRSRYIHQYLPMASKLDMTSNLDTLAYSFERRGWKFLALDARGPDKIDPHGLLPADQLEWVRAECASDGPPLVIFTHFPALAFGASWMDENLLMLNGEEFHQALLPARHRIRAVFFGHIHQSTQVMRDGILYCSAASAFSQFAPWPASLPPRVDSAYPPGFNFVTLLPDRLVIRQHAFSRPE